MDFMLEPMDLAEDTTFLTQLFASKNSPLPQLPNTAFGGVLETSHCLRMSSAALSIR